MGKYKYTLITSAILSCFLIGCGGGSTITKPASENSNAEAPAQQAEPATPSEQNNPVEPPAAEESSSPETPSAQEEEQEEEE